MECLKPPKALNLDSSQNLAETWKKWKASFKIFLQATESSQKNDLVKSSILLHCIGAQAKELYDTFDFPEGQEMVYNSIIEKFDTHFRPRKNLTFNRYTFLTARQEDSETFDEYFTRLRKLSEDCEFGDLRDSLIKDLIIIGITDKKLQERFLRENDLTLETVLKNGRACEASKKQTKELIKGATKSTELSSSAHVDAVKRDRFKGKTDHINQCKFCGGSHPRGSCPAYEKSVISVQKRDILPNVVSRKPPVVNPAHK